MANFKDKVILITGATSGIGAATATLFASHGARIAALDIRDPATPTATPDHRLDITCNVGDEDEVKRAVALIVEKWGTIDVLCNIAGIADRFQRLTETTTEELTRTMATNFLGPFHLMKSCIPIFLAKPPSHPGAPTTATGTSHTTILPPTRGAIINVCSIAAVRGAAAGAPYTASKHALLGLSRNTSWMYLRDGIRTNVVVPGGVATDILGNSVGGVRGLDPVGAGLLAGPQGVMPAVGRVEQVAAAVVWLAGADGVNGAEVAVDQGWLAA